MLDDLRGTVELECRHALVDELLKVFEPGLEFLCRVLFKRLGLLHAGGLVEPLILFEIIRIPCGYRRFPATTRCRNLSGEQLFFVDAQIVIATEPQAQLESFPPQRADKVCGPLGAHLRTGNRWGCHCLAVLPS